MSCFFAHKPGDCSGPLDGHHLLSKNLLKRTFPHGAVRERPRLLDLFCGAGGAAMGYHRAGFEVVGVDIEPQPNYPFEFVQMDALGLLENLVDDGYIPAVEGPFDASYDLRDFAAIHASPPCQAFTQMSARWRGKGTKADTHLDLLTPTREALLKLELPWVIENVVGARDHMNSSVTLHGGMFGLGVHRPRLFESNVLLLAPRAAATKGPIGVYGTKPDGRTTYRYRNNGNYKGKSLIRAAKSIEEAREAMGIEWMTWEEIREAIPPTYTELVGAQLKLPKTYRPLDRRESTEADVPLRAILDDPRNLQPTCRLHHSQHHNARFTLSRSELPDSVEQFAADYGLEAQLDRLYGPEEQVA